MSRKEHKLCLLVDVVYSACFGFGVKTSENDNAYRESSADINVMAMMQMYLPEMLREEKKKSVCVCVFS